MRIRYLLKASLLAPALLLAVPAAAQTQPPEVVTDNQDPPAPAQPVDPNAIQGRVETCQCGRTEHKIQLEAGRRYHITVTSDEIDPYMELDRAGLDTPLAMDDDSGGGLNARITHTATETGEYRVFVSSVDPSVVGTYSLSVTPAAPLPALVTRAARTERGAWRIYQGELAATDAEEQGVRYDDYELRLAEGQTAMIHVRAAGEDMDTKLQIYKVADRGGEILAEDDDGGGLFNPFLFFAPHEAGTYVVRVSGYDETTAGRYQLRISE